MARLGFPHEKWNPNNFGRLVRSMQKAVETYDFDSGWIATPSDKIVQHKLGLVPKYVTVYASASPDGNPFQPDSFVSCTDQQVTITGPSAYCRVLIDV